MAAKTKAPGSNATAYYALLTEITPKVVGAAKEGGFFSGVLFFIP